jgi:hypothetical protein
MTATRNFFSTVGLMAIGNESFLRSILNLKQNYIIKKLYMYNTIYKTTIINMAMVRNFVVISIKFAVKRLCTYVTA